MTHTKVLLFVDDQQTQIVKLGVLGEQSMSANNNIHKTCCHVFARFFCVLCTYKPRQGSDFNGKSAKAFRKTLVVLARQQSGRRNDCHLHARHRCNERRTHRYFGFAKAHITANKTIHRLARAHVCQNITNRTKLIIGLLVRKTRGERIPHARRRLHNGCATQSAFCRNANKLVGHLANAFFEFGLFALPCTTAKTVQQTLFVTIFAK